ncbi:MAG: nucleotide sugar dehydrogenase [Thermoplasmata archaeon]
MKVGVVGLGYVGIPVASSFAHAGHAVVGVDIDGERIETLRRGENPLATSEVELDRLINQTVSEGSLSPTSDYDVLVDANTILICVDTPLDNASRKPLEEPLRSATEGISTRLRKGALVSVESTIAPGTMEGLVAPTLEGGSGLRVHEDFALVHCPERVTPGRLLPNLVHLDRVVGGEDPPSRQRAIEFYASVCQGEFHETSWINAELSKTTENAYRDVQLAFANEVARISRAVGGDVYEVRDLVNTCPGREMLLPGPGVGGHCIPKDPWLLVSPVDDATLIPAAREVNDAMPESAVELVTEGLAFGGQSVRGATVVLLGAAYRENVAETVNSPSLRIYGLLDELGADLRVHDPFVPNLEGIRLWRDLDEASEGAHCLVFVTPHDVYSDVDWKALGSRMQRRLLVDCRGAFSPGACQSWGFQYRGLGRGSAAS